MYFFKCHLTASKKKFPEIEDFAALGAYVINYIRVLVPDDAYLIWNSVWYCFWASLAKSKKKEIGKQKRRLTIASARRWCRMIYIQRPAFILKCVIQGFRDAPLALPFENAILEKPIWPLAGGKLVYHCDYLKKLTSSVEPEIDSSWTFWTIIFWCLMIVAYYFIVMLKQRWRLWAGFWPDFKLFTGSGNDILGNCQGSFDGVTSSSSPKRSCAHGQWFLVCAVPQPAASLRHCESLRPRLLWHKCTATGICW